MAGEQQLGIDESTTDPVALQALFDKLEKGEDAAPTQTEEERQAEAAAADEAEKARLAAEEAAAAAAKEAVVKTPATEGKAAPTKEAAQEQDPDGVATKDGKHIIPYSVLQAERERNATTAKELETTRARLAELEAAAKATTGVKPEAAAPGKANADEMSDEDLAVLKEDFPTVYKGIMAMRAQTAALEARLKPVQETVEQDAATRQRTQAEQVQEAIDATPKLAHIKATAPDQFELATQIDKTLRTQPEWQGKSFTERFAKVVELVEAVKGEIVIPGAAKPAPAPAAKTQDQLKAEALAIAAAAAKSTKTGAPGSLSDFPAGGAVKIDEKAAVETMSSADLSRMFARMSPDEMDAYLSKL